MTKTATVLVATLILAGACGQEKTQVPEAEAQKITQAPAYIPKTEPEEGRFEARVKQNPLEVKAEAGDAEAQYLIGDSIRFYGGCRYGEESAESMACWREVIDWYRKAAYQGHADAQYFLGEAYCNWRGLQGVDHDIVECYAWTHLSCEGTQDKEDYADCREMRDATGMDMTTTQVRQAQQRATKLQVEIEANWQQ